MPKSNGRYHSRRTQQSQNAGNDKVEKLCTLVKDVERSRATCDDNTATRKGRLSTIREGIDRILKKEMRPFCKCRQITVVNSLDWEKFAQEMEVPCPIHGPCRLGIVVSVMCYLYYGFPEDRKLDELIREYGRRCLNYHNQKL